MNELERLTSLRQQLRPAEFAAVLAVLFGSYAVKTLTVMLLAMLAMLALPAILYGYGKRMWDSRESIMPKHKTAVDQFSAFRHAQRRRRPTSPRRWQRAAS